MFENLLAALLEERGLVTSDQIQLHLEDLKPIAKLLWRSYRTNNINVDYTDPNIQLVYMTRYFPFYCRLIRIELNEIIDDCNHLAQKNDIVVSLFGSGPIPEAVGISQFLSENFNPQVLEFISFDINQNEWREMRQVVRRVLISNDLPKTLISNRAVQFDLGVIINPTQLDIIRRSDIIVFQNCLNELNTNQLQICFSSIQQIVQNLQVGAVIVFIERTGYLEINNFLLRILGLWEQYGLEMLTNGIRENIYTNRYLRDKILETECSHFLEKSNPNPDGLLLSPSVTYCSIILKRPA